MSKLFSSFLCVITLLGSASGIAEDQSETLFDGKSLDGWECVSGAPITGWFVRDGVLQSSRDAHGLMTVGRYADFDFECEFFLDPKSDCGIALRGRYELQLLDDSAFPKVPSNEKCGAIFRQHAPSESAYRSGDWNNLKVRLVGTTVTVKLNDKTIIDRKQIRHVSQGAVNQKEQAPGPMILQSQGSVIRFRKISIRRIDP